MPSYCGSLLPVPSFTTTASVPHTVPHTAPHYRSSRTTYRTTYYPSLPVSRATYRTTYHASLLQLPYHMNSLVPASLGEADMEREYR
eukprot:3342331-Rhodomonas_salina.1